MANDICMVCGLDIGNGYVKGKAAIDGRAPMTVDLPSVVTYTTGVDMPREATDDYMARLDNELDATVVSRAVSGMDAGRVFFGQRGIRSGQSQREFNIENHVPKCQDALSTMLVLGSIASVALRDFHARNHGLPDGGIDVACVLGIALPIEDFMEWKDVYASTLTSDDHQVTVHNFEHDISVRIHFERVLPMAEGAAAQYAITELGAKFLQLALDDARAHGANIDDAYTGEILASVTNTIGIDVGEGTVNFPVFMDGDVSVESSRSINKGYGTVLTEVVSATRNTPGLSFESRKALGDFMLDDSPMPAKVKKRARLQHYVDEQVQLFVRDLMKEFSNIYRKVGANIDAVYIYGGGATAVCSALYPAVLAEVADETGESIPVIYLDSSYSRDLNRTGLYELACLGAAQVWLIE